MLLTYKSVSKQLSVCMYTSKVSKIELIRIHNIKINALITLNRHFQLREHAKFKFNTTH